MPQRKRREPQEEEVGVEPRNLLKEFAGRADLMDDPTWQERDTLFDAEIERDVELLLVDGSVVKATLHTRHWAKVSEITIWSIAIKAGENIDNIKRQLFPEEAAIAQTDFPIYAVKKWRPQPN